MVLRTLLVGLAVSELMVGGAAAELRRVPAGTVMALNASQATAPNETCPSLVRWFGPAYAEFALMHWTRQPRPNCSSVWHRPPQWYVSCEPGVLFFRNFCNMLPEDMRRRFPIPPTHPSPAPL